MPQFTEEEARQIFARAAERQHAATDSGPGLSIDELTEIGESAGLSPEHVAAAIQEIRSGRAEGSRSETVMGIETQIVRTRILPGELTDELWESMVSRLRRTFKTKGLTTEVGRSREWTGTNSEGGLSNLHISAVPLDDGTRVTIETSRTSEVTQFKYAPLVFLLGTVLFPAIGALKGEATHPGILFLAVLFAAFAVIMRFGGRYGYRKWSERRQSEFESLLDQFELAARASPALTNSTASSSEPALGNVLDELASAPHASSTSSPDRLRS